MNELYLIKSGDNGFVEETSAVISADSGEISINDSLYVESAGNIGIGSSNPVNKLDVVGSASISSDLTVQGITFTNVGGQGPSEANDIIMYNGSDWVVAAASQLPGGGGGAGNSAVPAGLINTLTQGDAIHEVTFGYDASGARIVYDNVPKIAASLEIDGAGEIIPHTVSGVSESGYFVVFSEELPTANYRMHTVFGGTDAFWETGVANLEYSDRNVEVTRSLYVGQKVGIGTTNPSSDLHVDSSLDGPIFDSGGTGNTNHALLVRDSGGNQLLRVNNNGNVGIGTTSPGGYKLVLNSDSDNSHMKISCNPSSQASLFFGEDAGGGGTPAWIQRYGSTHATKASKIEVGGAGSGSWVAIQGDGADVLNVRGNGAVGIGTTSPSAKLSIVPSTDNVFALEVSNSSGTQRGGLFINSDNGSALYLKDNSSNTNILLDTTGPSYIMGDVGIGTTNPGEKLDVRGSINLRSGFNLTWDSDGLIAANSTNMQFHVAGGELMRITSAGNIGIGTTSPSSRLDIATSGGSANSINKHMVLSRGTANGAHLSTIRAGATNDVSGLILGVGSQNILAIAANGNVGIGTTNPGSPLHIKVGTDNHFEIQEAPATGNLRLITLNDARDVNVPIDIVASKFNFLTGNVGIGTTNPAQKLDVYGNIAVNGSTVHTSDDRVKHNEQTIVGALETLSKITPKKYIKTTEMYDANHDFELDADGNPIDSNGEPVEHRIEAGVIAQQVLTVDELAFAVSPEGVDEDGTVTSPHGLDYNSLFTYAIAAIQEQQTMIEDLKKEIEQLKS